MRTIKKLVSILMIIGISAVLAPWVFGILTFVFSLIAEFRYWEYFEWVLRLFGAPI